MPETKVQPEDIAAAEEIREYAQEVGEHVLAEVIAQRIAASRPPLVARLVGENERLRKALGEFANDDNWFDIGEYRTSYGDANLVPAWRGPNAIAPEDFAKAALSPAHALDLRQVERAISDVLESGHEEDDERLGYFTVQVDKADWARLAAALATLREVTTK